MNKEYPSAPYLKPTEEKKTPDTKGLPQQTAAIVPPYVKSKKETTINELRMGSSEVFDENDDLEKKLEKPKA